MSLLSSYDFELVMKYPPHGTFHSQNDCVFLHMDRGGDIKDGITKIYRCDDN